MRCKLKKIKIAKRGRIRLPNPATNLIGKKLRI